jgi:hypothetical protein
MSTTLVRATWSHFGLCPLGDVVATFFQKDYALCVQLDEARPLGGYVHVLEDRLDRAFGHAGVAVNAIRRIDIELQLMCRPLPSNPDGLRQ